jgi:hypothetical protein
LFVAAGMAPPSALQDASTGALVAFGLSMGAARRISVSARLRCARLLTLRTHARAPAGVLHVLTGPDHLAAISLLVSSGVAASRARAAWLGVRWGLGHRRACPQARAAAPRRGCARRAASIARAQPLAGQLTCGFAARAWRHRLLRSAGLMVVAAVFFGVGQRLDLEDVSSAGALLAPWRHA